MEPNVLELLKKEIHDLSKAVKEQVVPKETLLEMIEGVMKANQAANTSIPGEAHKFDVIPEPKSLIKRFELDARGTRPADQILRASNVRRNFYDQPIIVRDLATGQRSFQVIDERMEEIQHCADDLGIVHACMKAAGPPEYKDLCQQNERNAIKQLKSYRRWETLTEGLKAELDSTTSGEGDEWVPTDFSSQLTDAIVLAHVVAALFPLVRMPSEPFTMPTQTAKPKASVVAEGANAAQATLGAGKPTTANKSLATKIFKYFLDFTDEVVEDSIVAIVPFIRQWIVLGLTRGEETMIVNGDATGAHLDTDITLAEAPEKAFDALRQFGSANIYASGNPDPFTANAIRNTRALLSVGFRENPSDLVYITSGLGMLNMLQIQEILTLDKVGPMATILNGQVGQIDGSPVILSEHVREDLNGSGVFAAAQTKTIILCVHRPSFVRGSRRDPRVESDKTIKTGVSTMVATMRRGFLDIQDSSTFNNVAICANVD